MAIGFDALRRIQLVEQHLATLGMRIDCPRYAKQDQVSVYPLDDEMPTYTRDAELFIGTVEEVECWIYGYLAARTYDNLLGLSDDAKRAKKEQSLKNKQLLKMIETGKIQ